VSAAPDHSLTYLMGRLAVVESRVRAGVARRRKSRTRPDDDFLGLYLSDAEVDQLLCGPFPSAPEEAEAAVLSAKVEEAADAAESEGMAIRLRQVARRFELEPLDVELLLLALAPDFDARFERLYGYLHDDLTRRRASIGLALDLAQVPLASSFGRQRFRPGSPLVDRGLLLIEEAERPFLTRLLRVPDRVTMHLAGDDHVEPLVAPLVDSCGASGDASLLARSLAGGVRLSYLRESTPGTGRGLAAAAFVLAEAPAVVLDLQRLRVEDDPAAVAHAAAREAELAGGGLIAGPIERLVERGGSAVRAFAEACCPVVLVGGRAWDPSWSRDVPLVVDVPAPAVAERAAMWRASLNGSLPRQLDPAAATAHFRLGPEQVARAAVAASLQAALHDRPLDSDDLRAGARSQNGAGLERLARRIEPRVDWSDLVLPDQVLARLRELAARARHRETVLDDWCMGRRALGGRGITGLFAGESGTGKTMSAEVVAGDLGLDLYVIDLSTVVDKYIGETEKNLDRIFVGAEGVNGVLLFDEADALFGKRSEVKDARDRYANVEVAYLLQRMELFDGIAILTTNLRANVDEAFTRRLDVVVDFPTPEESDRQRLWEEFLGAGLPVANDVDLAFLAGSFELSGGNIRNIALTAAYLAADAGHAVTMADLVVGTEREYRKLGRLCVESEFGPYFELVTSDG
jgi:winged helix domain-containing protein/ATPase family protein associated with various cellular activities (AAA)